MKLNTITRYILTLIDSYKACRKTACRKARSFRAEFCFQRPSRRWATTHFKAYMSAKVDAEIYPQLMRDQFAKMIKTITLKGRFHALEVAA